MHKKLLVLFVVLSQTACSTTTVVVNEITTSEIEEEVKSTTENEVEIEVSTETETNEETESETQKGTGIVTDDKWANYSAEVEVQTQKIIKMQNYQYLRKITQM